MLFASTPYKFGNSKYVVTFEDMLYSDELYLYENTECGLIRIGGVMLV